MENQPQFDVIVWGATGFSGRPVVEYLYQHYRDGSLRWAMAGRDNEKLESLRREIGDDKQEIPLLIAESNDETSLRELCQQTKVIISTVGPYAWHGSLLVRLCAENGTHYCDLTGEVQWIRRMIDTHQETAEKTGAKIVPCCGFDSIPSDLGVFFLQNHAREKFGKPLQSIDLYVVELDGTMSGGTAQSLINVMEECDADPDIDKLIAHPYCLNPLPFKESPAQPDLRSAAFAPDIGQWIAPFIMAAINTRVVQRSNALSGYAYGDDFTYQEIETMGVGGKGRFKAMMASFALGCILGGLRFGPTRWFLKNFVLPKTGDGPPAVDPADPGSYELLLIGKTADNQRLSAVVKGDAEAGYGSTPKMLAEAAICLAKDIDTDVKGGFWTPATVMGNPLLGRLPKAGVTFELAN